MKKFSVRELVLISVFSALLVAVQTGLSFLPNIELVSFLLVIFTLILGWKVLWAVMVFVLVEGLIYGFGAWWFSYTYVWAILVFAAYLFRKRREPLVWALVSGTYGLLFGTFCSFAYGVISGFNGVLPWIASGLLFDVIHGVSNFAIALILFGPVWRVAEKLMIKYGYSDPDRR